MNAILDEPQVAKVDVAPLIDVLTQLADLLTVASDEQYVAKPVGVVDSSLAGHARHCLDHVDSYLAGVVKGEMTYDDRRRGTDIETNRQAALRAIQRQIFDLRDATEWRLDQPIQLRVSMSADGNPIVVETSLGRELAFVMSHTIHHNALVGVIAKIAGIAVPERFGYAPSTLAHAEKRRCAR